MLAFQIYFQLKDGVNGTWLTPAAAQEIADQVQSEIGVAFGRVESFTARSGGTYADCYVSEWITDEEKHDAVYDFFGVLAYHDVVYTGQDVKED